MMTPTKSVTAVIGLTTGEVSSKKKAVCRVTLKVHADSGKQEDIVMNKLKELLQKDYVILDGGMGTMLQAAGMKMGETPEMLNITEPELLISIHEQYLKAGADIIYANTFGGNRYKLEECGHSVDELVTAGIKMQRRRVPM